MWGLLAILVAAAGCGGSSHGNLASPTTVAPESNAVSVAGLSPSDLESNISAARAAGKSVRYVSVQTPTGTDVYSVYAQIVRSDRALLVRTYGRIQVYALATTKLVYSAAPNKPVDVTTLPLVVAPNVDKAFAGNAALGVSATTRAQLCSNCAFVLLRTQSSVQVSTAAWPVAQDPWQLSIDYVFWKPGSDGAIAMANKRMPMFGNGGGGPSLGNPCPVSVQCGGYGGSLGFGPPSVGVGGGPPPAPPSKSCPTRNQAAGTAYAGLGASNPVFGSIGSNSSAPYGQEAAGWIYSDDNGNFRYDPPTITNLGQNGETSLPVVGSYTGWFAVGWYHTHPFNPNISSTQLDDVTGLHFSQQDISATPAGTVAYVAVLDSLGSSDSPVVRFYSYDPSTNKETNIANVGSGGC